MSNGVARPNMPHPESSEVLIRRFTEDPFALASSERLALFRALQEDQRRWLPRVRALVEPPAPDATFPAFLLALPPFAALAGAVCPEAGRTRRDLGTGVLDELQRFVDHYREWLEGDARRDEIWDLRSYSRSA